MADPTPPQPPFTLSGDPAGAGAVLIFDGKGGVKRHDAPGEAPKVPLRGFILIAGNSRAPDFRVWMKEELGDFHADLLSAPSTRARCTVVGDKALVVIRVARPGAAPDDMGRQLMSLLIEKGRVTIASELNVADFLGLPKWESSHHQSRLRTLLRASGFALPTGSSLWSRCWAIGWTASKSR